MTKRQQRPKEFTLPLLDLCLPPHIADDQTEAFYRWVQSFKSYGSALLFVNAHALLFSVRLIVTYKMWALLDWIGGIRKEQFAISYIELPLILTGARYYNALRTLSRISVVTLFIFGVASWVIVYYTNLRTYVTLQPTLIHIAFSNIIAMSAFFVRNKDTNNTAISDGMYQSAGSMKQRARVKIEYNVSRAALDRAINLECILHPLFSSAGVAVLFLICLLPLSGAIMLLFDIKTLAHKSDELAPIYPCAHNLYMNMLFIVMLVGASIIRVVRCYVNNYLSTSIYPMQKVAVIDAMSGNVGWHILTERHGRRIDRQLAELKARKSPQAR